MNDIFVSPTGDDDAPGTLDRPFATIPRALEAARQGGEAVIHLRAGSYPPFELTDQDRDLTLQPHDQEEAVISGGRTITGWTWEDGVWAADAGDLDTRGLHVDGRRAERAGIEGFPGDATQTVTGYVTSEPLAWENPAGVEFVYRGVYPWTEARCPVAAVTAGGTEVVMAQPAFGWALDLYNSAWDGQTQSGPGLPTRIENDPSFLTEPGTFVLDRSRRRLLYRGERPGAAVAAEAGTVLRATGARNVTVRGLTFADTTWSRPGSPEGFLHYHSTGYYDGGPIEKVVMVEDQAWVTVPGESKSIPAAVTLDGCAGVTFERCRFTRMGATALGLSGGSGLTVRACVFDDLSASAVSADGSAGVVIEDNLIERPGLDYPGSPGIAVSGTTGCTIAHNEITDAAHCGIAAGPAGGTRILRNLVTGAMRVLADGGGVYVSGPQGATAADAALISGNVITDTRTPYHFALYTDYGAAWVTVEGNVVARADNTAVLQVFPPLENVTYRGNFWDADPVGSDAVPPGVTYEDNTTLTGEALEDATAHIRARAGRRLDPPGPLEAPAIRL
ncbi:right-handed parallel beta-helix repeat-containing protein [Nonomuraea sp. C10]|nr:right-handed parallel beta-helix repeat-containing protein [Nonomuraea sp. C10]